MCRCRWSHLYKNASTDINMRFLNGKIKVDGHHVFEPDGKQVHEQTTAEPLERIAHFLEESSFGGNDARSATEGAYKLTFRTVNKLGQNTNCILLSPNSPMTCASVLRDEECVLRCEIFFPVRKNGNSG